MRVSFETVFPVVREWLIDYFQENARAGKEWLKFPANPDICNKDYKELYYNEIVPDVNNRLEKRFPGENIRFNYGQLYFVLKSMTRKGELKKEKVSSLTQQERVKNGFTYKGSIGGYAYKLLLKLTETKTDINEFITLHDEFTAKLDEEVVKYFLEEKAKSDEIFLKLIKNLFEENHRLKIFQEIVESKETATNRLHKENIKLRKQLKEMDDLLKKERSKTGA